MSEPIIYIDRSDIRAGKFEEVRHAIGGLAEFVEDNSPWVLTYGIYLDEEAGRMTVVAVHPDNASLERHMDAGGPAFKKFGDLLDLKKIEVYGQPSDTVVDALHAKARMLGDGGSVMVNELASGFHRLQSVSG